MILFNTSTKYIIPPEGGHNTLAQHCPIVSQAVGLMQVKAAAIHLSYIQGAYVRTCVGAAVEGVPVLKHFKKFSKDIINLHAIFVLGLGHYG